MKRFLFFVLLLSMTYMGQAQLANGSKLAGNIVAEDINGNTVDIFADLDAGKTVVLDIFATWCGPCWSFHNAGVLKDLHAALGPDGTDQIRIYAIEGDSRTAYENLFMAVSGSTGSIGDWTEGVEYGIINDHTFNTLLNIAFFPTLYVIRPDRSVFEMGSYRYNSEVWQKTLLPTAEKDLIFEGALEDKTFCNTAIFSQRPEIINMGTTEISNVTINFSANGEETLIDLAAPLGVFESTTVNLGNKTYTSSVDIQISIDEIDGVADEADNLSILSANFIRPVVNKQKLIVNFTTDFYPGETSWRLRDNKNRTLITTTYNPGNEDSFGGGGEDANTTFSYDVDIENTDITCLTLTISDSFGDGMTAFNSSLPTPGVQLSLEDGTIIKPMLRSDWDFETSRPVFASADFTSSLQEASFVESLSVYPNPVGDILNVDIKIKDAMEYTLFVSDILGKHMTSMVTNAQYLDVNHLPSGIYFLNVKTEQGLYTYKFNKL